MGVRAGELLARCTTLVAEAEPWARRSGESAYLLHDTTAVRLHYLYRSAIPLEHPRHVLTIQRCVWASARRAGRALSQGAPESARRAYGFLEAAMDALAGTIEAETVDSRMKW